LVTQNNRKKPFFYEVDHGKPFAIAGLWQPWNDFETCCVITTEATPLAANVHDKMPVILDAPDYSTWLDPEADPSKLKNLLVPFDSRRMSVRPVNSFVNNKRNQGPQCLAPP
jgi:putative SOS response-associated peptidase YedK